MSFRGHRPEDKDSPLFVPVATVEDIPSGEMKAFTVLGKPIVVTNVEGEYYAFADYCLHWGVRLSDGCLQGNVVRCRAHGWHHDFVKGEVVASDLPSAEGKRMITFETKVLDGSVWVSTSRKIHK
jgi:nitrite reductase/ring-hydroxylating ferredoxin subunit